MAFLNVRNEISVAIFCPGIDGHPYRSRAQSGSEAPANVATPAHNGVAGVMNRTNFGIGGKSKKTEVFLASSDAINSG